MARRRGFRTSRQSFRLPGLTRRQTKSLGKFLGNIAQRGISAAAARQTESYAREQRDAIDRSALSLAFMKPEVALREYQKFGAKYLAHRDAAFLGDEMGLGKTIQALAAMGHLAALGGRHFAVICPLGLVDNWLDEIENKTHLKGHRVHGPSADEAISAWRHHGDVAVMSFESAARYTDQALAMGLDMVVIDEAHYIKNPNAKRTQVARQWLGAAAHKVLMTGTAVKNNRHEFISLVSYLDPSAATTLKMAKSTDAFTGLVSHLYLRRNQIDVLPEIPERIEVVDRVPMSNGDLARYRLALQEKNFMALRHAASHIDSHGSSAKIDRLTEILEEARDADRKVLVFSFFLKTLSSIAHAAGNDLIGTISGSTAPADRLRLVKKFSERPGFSVLALGSTTGGTGFNLQAASVVVLMEPQYSPMDEEQAIARAQRFGQSERVVVHRLVSTQGIDEILRTRLAQKRREHELLAGKDPLGFRVTLDEAAFIEDERRRFKL